MSRVKQSSSTCTTLTHSYSFDLISWTSFCNTYMSVVLLMSWELPWPFDDLHTVKKVEKNFSRIHSSAMDFSDQVLHDAPIFSSCTNSRCCCNTPSQQPLILQHWHLLHCRLLLLLSFISLPSWPPQLHFWEKTFPLCEVLYSTPKLIILSIQEESILIIIIVI